MDRRLESLSSDPYKLSTSQGGNSSVSLTQPGTYILKFNFIKDCVFSLSLACIGEFCLNPTRRLQLGRSQARYICDKFASNTSGVNLDLHANMSTFVQKEQKEGSLASRYYYLCFNTFF